MQAEREERKKKQHTHIFMNISAIGWESHSCGASLIHLIPFSLSIESICLRPSSLYFTVVDGKVDAAHESPVKYVSSFFAADVSWNIYMPNNNNTGTTKLPHSVVTDRFLYTILPLSYFYRHPFWLVVTHAHPTWQGYKHWIKSFFHHGIQSPIRWNFQREKTYSTWRNKLSLFLS